MINLFTGLAPNDQSIYYLSWLFGDVGSVLQSNQNSSLLLSMMFKTLNGTALVLGSLIVIYTTVVGLIKTAAEGEFLGKEWKSLWVPLRMVMGIAALFPTSTGYSALQVFLMWIILQGVGAADTLWNTVLSEISIAGSPYAGISLPTAVDVNDNMGKLYQVLSCEATAKNTSSKQYSSKDGSLNYYYYCATNTASDAATNQSPVINPPQWCATTPNLNFSDWTGGGRCAPSASNATSAQQTVTCLMGPPLNPGMAGGACGSIVIADADNGSPACSATDFTSQLQCAAYKGQLAVMNTIVNLFVSSNGSVPGYAQNLAQYDSDYIDFMQNVNPVPTTITPMMQNYCNSLTPPKAGPSTCCAIRPGIPGSQCEIIDGGSTPSFPGADSFAGSLRDPTNAGPISNIILPCGILATRDSVAKCVQPTNADNFVAISATLYKSAVNKAIHDEMTVLMTQAQSQLTGWEQDAQSTGWLLAGGYFYQMAKSNNNNLTNVVPTFSVTLPQDLTSGDSTNPLKSYRNNIAASNNVLTALSQASQNSGSVFASNPSLSQIGSSLGGAAQGITDDFMDALTGAGPGQPAVNPLAAVQSLGEKLLLSAQIIYVTFVAIAMTLLIVSALNVIGLGTGLTENPFEEGIKLLVYAMWAGVLAFVGWAITFGGMLAIYTPLIPYVIFTFGAIGWFIATIEAMIAAPFVALGILSPGGGEILGRADPALMIMLNIFLRPSLMIMGMMAGMLLAPVVVTMINAGFSGVMSSLYTNPGLIELIILMSMYVMMIITALNKCFSLIYMIPNGVMKWIGGQELSYGEAESLGQVKGAADSAAGAASGAATGGMQASGSSVQAEHVKRSKAAQAKKASLGGGGAAPTTPPAAPPAEGGNKP